MLSVPQRPACPAIIEARSDEVIAKWMTFLVKCAISVLAASPHDPIKRRAPALQYMQRARETEHCKRSPPESGDFFMPETTKLHPKQPCCRRVGLPGGGTPGPAAGRGLCAGPCRGLGRSLRGPDPLWAGADIGPACGLLCRLRSRSCAGHPVPRVRGVFTGQPLPALRRGGGRGRPMALARQAPPGISGRVRDTGAGRCLLCAGARRGRLHAGVLLRGRCPAGGRLRAMRCGASARKARFWAPCWPLLPWRRRWAGVRFGPLCLGVAACAMVDAALCCRGQEKLALAFAAFTGAALCAADPSLAPAAVGLCCGTAAAVLLVPGRRAETLAACAGGCVLGVLCVPAPGTALPLLLSAGLGLAAPAFFPKHWLTPVPEAPAPPEEPPGFLPPPPGWKQWPRAFPRWPRR